MAFQHQESLYRYGTLNGVALNVNINKNTTLALNHIFTFSVMLIITLRIADQIILYRQIDLWGHTLSAGVFVMPLYYYVGDAIAELFGYKTARRIIYYVLCCGLIFSIIVTLLNKIPAPINWPLTNEYKDVLGNLLRSNLAAFIIVPISSLLNAKILTKWKFMTKGKYFLLRSLGSSAIAEGVQTVLGCLLLFSGVMPITDILFLILWMYIVQISCGVIVAIPGAYVVNLIKRITGDNAEPEIIENPFAQYGKK